jgi:thymidylate synthase ThyX
LKQQEDISRQMIRHKSLSIQEFSQRYSDVAALGEMFVLSGGKASGHEESPKFY